MDIALRAIADHRRREILRLVRNQELPAGKIAEHFDVSRPAISQHLRVLKEAGLLLERHEGSRRFYRLHPEGMEEIHAFVESFWSLRQPTPQIEPGLPPATDIPDERLATAVPTPSIAPPSEHATEPPEPAVAPVRRAGRAHLRLISDGERPGETSDADGPEPESRD